MPDSNKGRHSRKVTVYDPYDTTKKLSVSAASLQLDETTLKATASKPFINDDTATQVAVRRPIIKKELMVDDAATTVLSREQLFIEAARLDQAAHSARNIKQQQMLERTIENPKITDYLPSDIRPTVATAAISGHTIADQEVVQIGTWREFIVEVDNQLCLIVPIEIARSGLLKPGRRLVVRIRTLDE